MHGEVVVTRIELDGGDRLSVDHARRLLAESEQLDTGTESRTELLVDIGRLRAAVEILLRIVDGGDRP